MTEDRLNRILKAIRKNCPYTKTGLHHKNPFDLLISTILSAQCTDTRVNIVTDSLFKKYKRPEDYIKAGRREIEKDIRTCGLYRNKARNIIEACRMIENDFKGKIPNTRDQLLRLPGVGRKTANVIISNAFGGDAIAVDTHVFRVANRIGLVNAKTAVETERQLMSLIPRKVWSQAHHWLIHHGRTVCKAIRPRCDACEIRRDCLFVRRLGG